MRTADKKKKKKQKRPLVRLSPEARAYIVAQMAGLEQNRAGKQARRLAGKFGISAKTVYEISMHVRPRKATRSDKTGLIVDIERMIARTDKTVADYDVLIGSIKEEIRRFDRRGRGGAQRKEDKEMKLRFVKRLQTALREKQSLLRENEGNRAIQRIEEEQTTKAQEEAQKEEESEKKKLPEWLDRLLRAHACAAILSSKRLLCELLGYKWAPYYSRCVELEKEHRHQNMVKAPRGGGKSTLRTIVSSIDDLLHDYNVRIGIFSDASAQAEGMVFEIALHLQNNETLIWAFGPFYKPMGRRWRENSIIIAQRTANWKEGTVDAWGKDSRGLVSRHYDVLNCDDLVSEENARTETQRAKTDTFWKKKIRPCRLRHTRTRFTGTRYHYADQWAILEKKLPKDAVLTIRAITEDARGREHSYWPSMFPLESRQEGDEYIEGLRETREECGTIIWNCQYQNDTELMKGEIFKYEWMQFVAQDQVPENLRIYQGADLAIGEKDTSAYTAIITIGYEQKKRLYYILNVHRARMSFAAQTAALGAKAKEYDSIKIGIESNAYQKAQSQETRRLTEARVKEIITDKDKVTRAMKLSALFEADRVFILQARWTGAYVDEFLAAPNGEWWDQIDGTDIAVRTAQTSGARIRIIEAA